MVVQFTFLRDDRVYHSKMCSQVRLLAELFATFLTDKLWSHATFVPLMTPKVVLVLICPGTTLALVTDL